MLFRPSLTKQGQPNIKQKKLSSRPRPRRPPRGGTTPPPSRRRRSLTRTPCPTSPTAVTWATSRPMTSGSSRPCQRQAQVPEAAGQ
eukprot:4184285-Pyramimonas_sp.AAC.1